MSKRKAMIDGVVGSFISAEADKSSCLSSFLDDLIAEASRELQFTKFLIAYGYAFKPDAMKAGISYCDWTTQQALDFFTFMIHSHEREVSYWLDTSLAQLSSQVKTLQQSIEDTVTFTK